jgi:uncharacterized protein (DUF983 family)
MNDVAEKRPIGSALANGLKCRCPRCGQGRLFWRYLKIVERCENCGLELNRARADDLPAYIGITIVGHVLVMALLHFQDVTIQPWIYLLVMGALAVVLPLAMLPSIKGAVVAIQWANRMHGL